MDYVIGIDMGATKIHSALVSMKGKIIEEYKTLTESDKSSEVTISKIRHSISKLWNKDVKAIGIGIPGPIDRKTKKAYPPNIPNIKGINIAKELSEYKDMIVTENDSNCFVLAEHRFGEGRKYNNIIGITLGTGVGGGIIANGQLLLGEKGMASEIGHITIDKDGYLCNCGNHGCLEMYASGTAIEMRTLRHIKIKDIPTRLKEEEVTALKVHYVALKGDKLAKKVMSDTGRYLGIGISALINVFNPGLIVFGGGVSVALPSMNKTLSATIKERAMHPANKVRMVVSRLKHPGTLGAACVAIDFFKENQGS
ncbi:MAG: ROK family protein [Candidatus Woesearchaeota archaeon]